MGRRRRALRVGGVAPAARDDAEGGSPPARRWDTRAASWWPGGTPRRTLAATLDRLADGSELVTCLAGTGAPLDREWVEAHVPDGVEVEYHEGGQPAWWWLLCAE